jgi:hypothetical protein
MSQDVLFVLTQNDLEMQAVKSSNLLNIFKNIIFVEPELYKNTELNIPQPIELGGMLVNIDKINSFVKNINTDEKLIKGIENKNYFVLSFVNFLKTIDNDISGVKTIKAYDAVNVHLFNKETFTYTIGGLAEIPNIYVEELKTISKPIFQNQDGTNKPILLGCNKTIGSLSWLCNYKQNVDPQEPYKTTIPSLTSPILCASGIFAPYNNGIIKVDYTKDPRKIKISI